MFVLKLDIVLYVNELFQVIICEGSKGIPQMSVQHIDKLLEFWEDDK